MSLRARLLAVVVSLTALGLVVASFVTYKQLQTFLVDPVDRTAEGSADAIAHSLEHGRPGPGGFDAIGLTNPGLYVGAVLQNGTVQWAAIGTRPGDTPLPQPNLTATRARTAAALDETITVNAVNGGSRFRVRLEPIGENQLLVVAAPLNDA